MFNFIKTELGDYFTNPPPFKLDEVYKDSAQHTPLIFVLSPGADPLASLKTYAEKKNKNIDKVSLG